MTPGCDLRGATAIVGIGEGSILGAPTGSTPLDLIGQAAAEALADAGLTKNDVDGLFGASAYYPFVNLNVGEYLGIRPRFTDSTNSGGSSFVSHLFHASLAIHAGLCDVALITYGSTQKSDGGKLKSPSETLPYEAGARMRYPIGAYALAASRHMFEFGTTRRQLAEVAVAARAWAHLNPSAARREPLSLDDVLNSRMVSTPLTVRDCCLVTDGAGAVVVTSAERAADLRSRPVFFLGAGEAHWQRNISQQADLTTTAATESSARAYAMAGVRPADIDVVELYDAFSINTLLFLEDLGFCNKGEGGSFVEGGAIAPAGRLPVNTNGGGLSYGHPGMYGIFLVTEAVCQLRGTAGDRQVRAPHHALVHANGGVLSSQVTAILGVDRT